MLARDVEGQQVKHGNGERRPVDESKQVDSAANPPPTASEPPLQI
jgi:hypothetical protein